MQRAWSSGGWAAVLGMLLALAATAAQAADQTATWQGAAGDWNDSGKWSTANYPNNNGTTYDVVIDSGTVDLNQDIEIQKLDLGDGIIDGTSSHHLWCLERFTWTDGELKGGHLVLATGGAALSGETKFLGCTLSLSGPDNPWTGGDLRGYTGCDVLINGGATFDAQCDETFGAWPGGEAVLTNCGTFRKSGGTGSTLVNATVTTDHATVEVSSGILHLAGDSTGIHADYWTHDGGTLMFSSSTHALDADSGVRGDGAVEFSSGTWTSEGTWNVSGSTKLGGITGATVNFDSDTTFTGPLAVSAGTLAGSGAISVGNWTWAGGFLQRPGMTTVEGPGATLTISPPSYVHMYGHITNKGTATWTDGDIRAGHNAWFINEAGTGGGADAVFDCQGDLWYRAYAGVQPTFENRGEFRKSAGTGAARFGCVFNNRGTANVQTGTLRLYGGGTHEGEFAVATGAQLEFGGGTHDLRPGLSFSGSGSVELSAGELGVYSEIGILNPFTLTDGTITGNAALGFDKMTWTAGRIQRDAVTNIVNHSSTLDISGTGVKYLYSDLQNFGTTAWTGGEIRAGYGARFYNAPDLGQGYGTFDVQGDFWFRNYAGTMFTFENAGWFLKSAGTTVCTMSVRFENSGYARVESGMLELFSGTASGEFAIFENGTLMFGPGSYTIEPGADLWGTGAWAIQGNTLTFDADDQVNTPLTFHNGTLGGSGHLRLKDMTWRGGSIDRDGLTEMWDDDGTLTITTDTVKYLYGDFVNHAQAVWDGGDIRTGRGVTFTNAAGGVGQQDATFEIHGDQDFDQYEGDTAQFINEGYFHRKSGTGVVEMEAAFTNCGEVWLDSGTVNFKGGYTQTAGTTSLKGGTFQSPHQVQIQGGRVSGGGNFKADVVVSGTGRFSPGDSPGILSLEGDYTQQAGATLEVEIGGLTVGSDYDRLEVTGAAALDGTLAIVTLDPYVPDPGDAFTVLTYASHTGAFAEITGRHGGQGRFYDFTCGPTAVVLTAWQAADGDTDGDRDVDAVDLASLGLAWAPDAEDRIWTDGDFDGDGDVDAVDLASLGLGWRPDGYATAPSPAPEPATLGLLAAGTAAPAIRRRRSGGRGRA